MIGLAVGALGTSILMQFAPAPMQLVFIVLIAVMVIEAIVAGFLPDLASKRPGIRAAIRPTVSVHKHAWRALLLIAPLVGDGWALGGIYFSLGTTLALKVPGRQAPLIEGRVVFTLAIVADLRSDELCVGNKIVLSG